GHDEAVVAVEQRGAGEEEEQGAMMAGERVRPERRRGTWRPIGEDERGSGCGRGTDQHELPALPALEKRQQSRATRLGRIPDRVLERLEDRAAHQAAD